MKYSFIKLLIIFSFTYIPLIKPACQRKINNYSEDLLYAAAQNGDVFLVQQCIQNHIPVNNNDGLSPLDFALNFWNENPQKCLCYNTVCSLLLSYGADSNKNYLLHKSIEYANHDAVAILINNKKTDLEKRDDLLQETPLLCALRMLMQEKRNDISFSLEKINNRRNICSLLVNTDTPCNIAATDQYNRNAVTLATMMGEYQLLEQMLPKKTIWYYYKQTNMPDFSGKTPLMHAVLNGCYNEHALSDYIKCIEVLLKKDADPYTNINNISSFSLAEQNQALKKLLKEFFNHNNQLRLKLYTKQEATLSKTITDCRNHMYLLQRQLQNDPYNNILQNEIMTYASELQVLYLNYQQIILLKNYILQDHRK